MNNTDKEAELKKKEAKRKKNMKTAKNAGITLGVGVPAYFGLEKLQEWARTQGDTWGKVSSGLQIAGGFALQFAPWTAAKAAGGAMMLQGGTSLPREFITDENYQVKPDNASQTLAKAIMPGSSLNGLAGLGNLHMAQLPAGGEYQAVPQGRSLLAR